MEAQLDKLLKFAENERATIQVLPFQVGAHASTDSNFEFLEFLRLGTNESQKPVVFVEGIFSNLYEERPIEIDRCSETIEYPRDAGLNPCESVSLI